MESLDKFHPREIDIKKAEEAQEKRKKYKVKTRKTNDMSHVIQATKSSKKGEVGHSKARESQLLGSLESPKSLPESGLIEDVFWLEEYETTAETNLHAPIQGEYMENAYRFKGQEIGKETVKRSNVIATLKKGYEDKIAYLKGQLESVDRSPTQKEQISLQMINEMRNLEKVEKCDQKQETWAASSSYRRLLEHSETLDEAHENYIPACVNLRTQQVFVEGEIKSSFNRSGAVSDYRHGHTNLVEMGEAYSRLTADAGLASKDSLNASEPIRAELRKKIEERREVCVTQALQDLSDHFTQLAHGDFKALLQAEAVVYGRVSMLDGLKPGRKDGDFVLNEKNQMLDMQVTYEYLNGKTLVFDGTGPFVDLENNIHIPVVISNEDKIAVSKPLQTIYFNISTQGNIENEGPQQKINERALEQMRSAVQKACLALVKSGDHDKAQALESRLQSLSKALGEGGKVSNGFKSAEVASLILQEIGALLSINCFSGKDRTGLLAEMLALNYLKNELARLGVKEKSIKVTVAKWGRQTMAPDGLASKVVKDNTGFRTLKVTPAKLPVLKGVLGTVSRVALLTSAVSTFVLKPGDTGGGQLWSDAA